MVCKKSFQATTGNRIFTWEASLITCAVVRAAACWQLNRTEPQVCDLLAGLKDGLIR